MTPAFEECLCDPKYCDSKNHLRGKRRTKMIRINWPGVLGYALLALAAVFGLTAPTVNGQTVGALLLAVLGGALVALAITPRDDKADR